MICGGRDDGARCDILCIFYLHAMSQRMYGDDGDDGDGWRFIYLIDDRKMGNRDTDRGRMPAHTLR
jgi:hypothetical protein